MYLIVTYRGEGVNMSYLVKPGDTLSGIYGNDWAKQSQYTGDPRKLQVGTELPDPVQSISDFRGPAPAPVSNKPVAPQNYFNPPAPTTPKPQGMMPQAPAASPSAPSMPKPGEAPSPDQFSSFNTDQTSPVESPEWAQQQVNELSPTTPGDQSDVVPAEIEATIPKPNKNLPDEVWSQVLEGAKKASLKHGIPASLIIAQFLQETGGNPDHFIGGTNVFGIKGAGNAGSTTARTLEYDNQGNPYYVDASFAKYNSIPDSIEAHTKLLTENPAYSRIQKLIQDGERDPGAFAKALQGVYATDPKYAANLNNLIASRGLANLDDYANYPAQTPYTPMQQQARRQLDTNFPTQG